MQLDKVNTQNFSFFNFTKKKTPKFKKLFINFFNAFLIIQILLLHSQVFNIYNYFENNNKEGVQVFEVYDNLEKSLKKGDQESIIYEFISLKSKGLAITDLLSAIVLREKDRGDKGIENSYKMDKNTSKTLDFIFEKMSDTGYEKQKINLNELFSCSFINFSCNTMSYLMKKNMQSMIESVHFRSQVAKYDSQHPKEYRDFLNRFEQNSPSKQIIESPGALYLKNKIK